VAVVILIIQMKKLHLERLGFQFRSASSISLEEGGRRKGDSPGPQEK
jgi:hypothetical protein